MKITIPERNLLHRTNDVDYFDWNYKFPMKYVQLFRFKAIIKLLGNSKYPRLLEAGTGSGIFLPELSQHCDELFACDIHPHFDKVESLLRHYNIRQYKVKSQSIQKTDYPDEYFNAIVAVSVLEFVDDLQASINEIKRILKKDGYFFTICPMNSRFLDIIVSAYSKKSPKEEFGDSRLYVTKALEQSFRVLRKGFMMPLIGRYFPIYTYYKFQK